MTRDAGRFSDRDPLDLVRDTVVAKRWDKSPRTLQRWRAERYGPVFLVIGGSVYYRVGDILAFEERQRRGSGRRE